MKSGIPENSLLEVLPCGESAWWTHLSQDYGSWRNNISANWLFFNPWMPVVSPLAFQWSNEASRSSNRLVLARILGRLCFDRWEVMPLVNQCVKKDEKLSPPKKLYLQISSIIIQRTLNNKYSLERRLLVLMQCDLKTTVKISEWRWHRKWLISLLTHTVHCGWLRSFKCPLQWLHTQNKFFQKLAQKLFFVIRL